MTWGKTGPLQSIIGPSGQEGLRRRTVTNLTVNATSQIFTTGTYHLIRSTNSGLAPLPKSIE